MATNVVISDSLDYNFPPRQFMDSGTSPVDYFDEGVRVVRIILEILEARIRMERSCLKLLFYYRITAFKAELISKKFFRA